MKRECSGSRWKATIIINKLNCTTSYSKYIETEIVKSGSVSILHKHKRHQFKDFKNR